MTMTKAMAKRMATEARAETDAVASVARETAKSIAVGYSLPTLLYMGFDRSYGESKIYRAAYAPAFVQAWSRRVVDARLAEMAAQSA